MDIPKIKECTKGLWMAIWGVKQIPAYYSSVEVIHVLRGDIQLALRLEVINENVLHPFISSRSGDVVAVLGQPGVFVSLLDDGWIASDEAGNYRPTSLGLEMLTWHESRHLELGDCPECGKPIPFPVRFGALIEKDAKGNLRHLHYACYAARSAGQTNWPIVSVARNLPS